MLMAGDAAQCYSTLLTCTRPWVLALALQKKTLGPEVFQISDFGIAAYT
jgi:hypothetical protein